MSQKTVKIGVLGLGSRGIYLAGAFHATPGAQVVALCDRNDKRFALARERGKLPDARTYTDYAAMLADPELDAVVIATHDKAHAANGMDALAAGKHVFLEKPMAQRVEDCDRLIEAWRASRCVFMVGLELRYCSVSQDLKALVERGDIGEVKLAYAVDNVSVGGQFFFHDALRHKDFVGNLLLQKGTHTIDLMNWFVDSPPVRVYAEGGLDAFGGDESPDKRCRDCDINSTCPYNMPRQFMWDYGTTTSQREDLCVYGSDVDIEDNTIVTVRYANGAKMTYIECHFTPDYNRHFTLIGTKGRAIGFYNNQQDFKIEVTYRHSSRRDVIYSEKREGSHGGSDPAIQAEFVRRVQRGVRCCPGVIGARDSAAIAAAAGQAMESGMPVMIPRCPLAAEELTSA
jgi:predicted dehydrogenase